MGTSTVVLRGGGGGADSETQNFVQADAPIVQTGSVPVESAPAFHDSFPMPARNLISCRLPCPYNPAVFSRTYSSIVVRTSGGKLGAYRI